MILFLVGILFAVAGIFLIIHGGFFGGFLAITVFCGICWLQMELKKEERKKICKPGKKSVCDFG